MQNPLRLPATIAAFLLAHPAQSELVLVENGESRMPIVIFADAPPLTRQAADELTYYIEKTSGARPEVLEGLPDPLPESAIWVGVQPVLTELFPDQDFDFQHPEEILIAANDRHLVIAGRDRWDPEHLVIRGVEGVQQEYGTHNAVYTFLHDYLGVRWLWPGELGEDVLETPTIAFEPFAYRYHPQVRARGGLLAYSTLFRGGPGEPPSKRGFSNNFWLRAQRLQLCELTSDGGHGPWSRWWDRFYETHPEYFALQPDGTRSRAGNRVTMCHSNPDIAEQWLDDVAAELEENPTRRVFNPSPTDGWTRGHCICEHCRAWDHPEGEIRRPFIWEGISQDYVALTDREMKFANRVARGLKERFPDRDLYVYWLAYGHSRPAPVEEVPDDNVVIVNVANFLLRSDSGDRGSTTGKTHRENFGDWGRVTQNNFWRPNTGNPVGWQWGMPDVPFTRTIEDMQFAADNGWMGIYVDYNRQHWATQGPLNYLMAQLTWNPHQDGPAILQDYYRRAFGPAAEAMEAYWTYMEDIREACYGTQQPGRADHDLFDFYNADRLAPAQRKLDRALAQAADGPEVYRRRIAFVQAGLDFTRLATECGRLGREIRAGRDPDGAARAQIERNWEQLGKLRLAQPGAFRWGMFFDRRGTPRLHRQVPSILLAP